MAALEVHSLLGHDQTPLSIKCLSSLARTSVEELAFVLHEDGTLTADDEKRLRDSIPVAAIIPRKESEARVLEMIKDYKYCHAYRIKEPIGGIKLFDIPLLCGSEIYYCDTDILFMAPHRGLFAGALAKADSAFTRDVGNAYALFPWQLPPFSPIGLLARINSGIFAMRKSAYSLEFIDRFFATFDSSSTFRHRSFHAEQTTWSALAAQSKCVQYDPVQFTIAYPSFPYDPAKTIGIHFVSKNRYMLPEYDHGRQEKDAPRDVILLETEWLRPPGYLVELTTRIVRNKLRALGGKR